MAKAFARDMGATVIPCRPTVIPGRPRPSFLAVRPKATRPLHCELSCACARDFAIVLARTPITNLGQITRCNSRRRRRRWNR